MDKPRIFKSAVDGKFYYVVGDPERSRKFEAAGGIVVPGNIADIEAVTILDEVLGLARPQYKLRALCRPVRMDHLTMRIDIATSLAGQEKVPPMVEANIVREAYKDVNFDLWKNVVHVALADESQMKAAHDILGMHTSDAGRDLPRMENKQIAEILDGCDNQQAAAGGSSSTHTWNTSTSGVSDANPYIDLLAAFTALQGVGLLPTYIAMHANVWAGFVTNTWVKSQVHTPLGTVTGSGISIPGFPTVRVLTDFAVLPITSVYVLATLAPAMVLGEGPTMAAKYRNDKAGYDAYIIRQWLEPKIIDFGTGIDAIVDITGAHS